MILMSDPGVLYICGTPIGNLEDITLRVLRVLKEVDLIAAEDTRRTSQLLNYYQIKTRLTSYHEHNEQVKAEQLLSLLKEGKNIALVSDAGMPGISDPGLVMITKALREGLEIIPVPGPTAAISALVVSGMATERFVFEGFLPRKGKERKARLKEIEQEFRTVILYESPYRLRETLTDLSGFLAERKIAVIREISKIHEEKIYGLAEEIKEQLAERTMLKGEIVLVIAGKEKGVPADQAWEEISLLEHTRSLMEQGLSKKEAIKEVASLRNLPKRKVYQELIVLEVDKEQKV